MNKKEDREERRFAAFRDRIRAEGARYLRASGPAEIEALGTLMSVHLEEALRAFMAKRRLLGSPDRFSDYLRKLAKAFRGTEAAEDRHRSKD